MTDNAVAGLVLAGGRGSRMGSQTPKPLVRLAGRPLVAHVLERFLHAESAISPILIGANDVDAFADFGFAVVPDRLAGFQGPLAGLDAASHHLERHHTSIEHLLVLPADTPFLPTAIAAEMTANCCGLPQVAVCDGALQPAVALWPLSCLRRLPRYLADGGGRSIRAFLAATGFETVGIPRSCTSIDPFFNVNTPSDLDRARAALEN